MVFETDKQYSKEQLQEALEWLVENDWIYALQENEEGFILLSKEPIKLAEQKLQAIAEKKDYLKNTDYVVIKIYEATIMDNTELVEQLKTEYADILQARQQAREEINELEAQ